jgi:hypothetical protein
MRPRNIQTHPSANKGRIDANTFVGTILRDKRASLSYVCLSAAKGKEDEKEEEKGKTVTNSFCDAKG